MVKEITEFRGIENLVYAEVLADTNEKYETGPVKDLAGVAELSRKTETSQDAHYYDNIPAITITSTGADDVTAKVSAIPLDVLADITGQSYDSTTGAFIEMSTTIKYFAIGYKTKKTNGDEIYVWRYKGTFSIPDSNHTTQNNSNDAAGQELAYKGIETTFQFTKLKKGAKAINVDISKGLISADAIANFFSKVTTPDMLTPKKATTKI